jgi:hypothetical protein
MSLSAEADNCLLDGFALCTDFIEGKSAWFYCTGRPSQRASVSFSESRECAPCLLEARQSPLEAIHFRRSSDFC